MRHLSRDRFTFGGNRLYFNGKYEGYYFRQDKSYSQMYWCYTPKGGSIDFYNISRVKQHILDLYMKDIWRNGVLEARTEEI